MSPATIDAPTASGGGQKITIENVGPISGVVEIDLSNGPGVYVLRGSKGAGKSTSLSCLELLAGHSADITLHDGAQAGKISGFGVVVPIGLARKADGKARISRQGEFAAATLDAEKFSIADITDPGIKDPVKADAHRIKALAKLARTKSEPADYYALAGGQAEFLSLVRADDLQTDDPVLMAARIKAAFDSAARNAESLADRAEGQAQACQAAVAGIDVDADCDPAALAEAVDAAVAERSRLKTLREAAVKATQLRADAEARLNKTRDAYPGPSLSRAQGMVQHAEQTLRSANARVAELQERLRAAQQEALKADGMVREAKAALQQVQQHAELVGQLEDLIRKPVADAPTDDELAAAEQALAEARAAQEHGVRVREAKRRWEEGAKHLQEAQEHRTRAEQLRAAAAGTFDVLMRSVKLDGVKVETVNGAPRLMVDHPRRGPTLFAELSDGEKVKSTIDLLLPVIGSPGFMPVSQRLFQDLGDEDVAEIDAYARERNVYLIGARIDRGPLRVEKWN